MPNERQAAGGVLFVRKLALSLLRRSESNRNLLYERKLFWRPFRLEIGCPARS